MFGNKPTREISVFNGRPILHNKSLLIKINPKISIIISILQLNLSFWGGKKKSTKPKQDNIDLKSVIKRKGKRNQRLHNFYMLFVIKSYLFSTTLQSLHVSWAPGKVASLANELFPSCARSCIVIMDFINPSRLLKIVLQLCSVKCLPPLICADTAAWRDTREVAWKMEIHTMSNSYFHQDKWKLICNYDET